jgi:hypothetical protein
MKLPPYIKFTCSRELRIPADFNSGTVYYEATFELNTPSYRKGTGPGFSDKDKLAFRSDAHAFAASLGYAVDNSRLGIRCAYTNDNHEFMHIHPDQITGKFLPQSLELIANELGLFSGVFRAAPGVTVWRLHELVSQEEAMARLDKYTADIKSYLMGDYVKLPNCFHAPSSGVALLPRLEYLPGLSLVTPPDLVKVINEKFQAIHEELVGDGLLTEDKHQTYKVTSVGVA